MQLVGGSAVVVGAHGDGLVGDASVHDFVRDALELQVDRDLGPAWRNFHR